MGRTAVLAFVFVLVALGAARATLPFGGLYVSSLPNGADVWIDGSYIGRTPLLVDGLRVGKHELTITKTGWKVQEIDQDVTAGVTTNATVQLEPIKVTHTQGTIALHGLDADARVRLDGGDWQTGLTELHAIAGSHRLSVREAAGKFERVVAVYPDQTTHVLFTTAPAGVHSAVVAPLADYLPEQACKIANGRLVIRWSGHVVVGHIGDAKFVVDGRDAVYDAPAGLVNGRLYVPLDLLLMLTGGKSK